MKAELIDFMGSDLRVVEAARVSFAAEAKWDEVEAEDDQGLFMDKVLSPKDTKLVGYLADNSHWTPFAHPHITLRMQAPVSIRTQVFKHKVGFVENEESRRYISGEPEFFFPVFRSAPTGGAKQGSSGLHYNSKEWADAYERQCRDCLEFYKAMIEDGVAPEQARFVLPQGTEVNWYWTGSLASYARFYNQRTDPHAQVEIQELAREVGKIIQPLFPVAWEKLTGEIRDA